jgi:transposase
VSSGPRKIYRLSRRGNRNLNYVIHMAALTQIAHRDNAGRAYFQRKIDEGMSGKSALRALKRKLSDALFATMIIDARRGAHDRDREDPGGQSGNDSASSAAGSHPEPPALRTSHSRVPTNSRSTDPETGPALRPGHARRMNPARC